MQGRTANVNWVSFLFINLSRFRTKSLKNINIVFALSLVTFSNQIYLVFFSAKLKAYPEIYELLLLDIEKLRTFTLDEESFLVLVPLWERKWTEEYEYPDERSKELVIDLIVYFKCEWVQPELVRGWYQGAAPLCANTNNGLER